MNREERLEQLLRGTTEGYLPDPQAFARITSKLLHRRRRRLAARSGAAVLAVGVVVTGVAVTLPGGHHHSQRVAVRPPETATTAHGTPALVSVGSTRAELLSPTTGQVLSEVQLAAPLPSTPVGQIATDPEGSTAYVAVDHRVGDSSCPYRLIAINLHTGAETLTATGASAPALNPAGTELAFLTGLAPAVGGQVPSCTPTTVTVEDLRTGVRRSWEISPTPATGRATQGLESLSWAPRGPDLLVGSQSGPFTGIQVLDTSKPTGAGNPVTVGPRTDPHRDPVGRYSSPVSEADGTIAAVAPRCWGGTGCPMGPYPTQIEAVDRATGKGRIIATFPHATPAGLASGPAGTPLIAELSAGSRIRLVTISGHRTKTLATVPGLVAWAAHIAAPRDTTARKGKVTVTLALPSHTIVAGASMLARIIVNNGSGHVIRITGCGGIFAVVLSRRGLPNAPIVPTCAQIITIPTGRSVERLTLQATYQQCGGSGLPKCSSIGIPSLPAGDYEATVYESGRAIPVPGPQPVKVVDAIHHR